MKKLLWGILASMLGFMSAAMLNSAKAAEIDPTSAQSTPRFWMSDFTRVGGTESYSVFILHDNKFREVCFLVVAGNGDSRPVTMAPRQC